AHICAQGGGRHGGAGDYRRDSSGTSGRGGSSNRYHDTSGSSSYDKRGGNDHHSSGSGAGGSGAGGSGSGGNTSRDRYENRSSSRGRGDKSRETMGPPRSLHSTGPRNVSGSRGPTGGSRGGSMGSRPMGLGLRRGAMRGRISNFRNDGRRGIITNRLPPGVRDMRRGMAPLRRRFPPTSFRGRDGIGRIGKRSLDNRQVTRKQLIKRALAAAKELDDDNTTENEGGDDDEDAEEDEDKDTLVEEGGVIKKEKTDGDEEEDDGDKTEKEEDDDEDADADKTMEKDEDEEKEGDEKAEDSKETQEGDGETKKDATASPKKTTKKVKSEKNDKDGEKKKKDTKINTKYHSSFIKLNCCHCGTKSVTFKEYHAHLFRGIHKTAMRKVAVKTREKLQEMRSVQRAKQKEEDEKLEDAADQKSSYCLLCQLSFRQPKAVHQKSDGHKEMKRYLMPYCSTCKIGFKSPMAYEAHRASIEHLKFKARVERYATKEDSGEDGAEIDLENFTTVDEVGDVDAPTDTSKENASTPKKGDTTGRPGTDDDDDDSDDVDEDTIIGEEHVKKVEVQYCDLCNIYLPRRDDPEKVLRMHCKSRPHLKQYIRQREDKKLRERAERIHKKKLTDAKSKRGTKEGAKEGSEPDAGEKAAEKENEAGEGEGKEGATDEQMWEVVDNDIGDLLREVVPEDGEEEEDDEKTSSERFDKFKHTEKNGLDQSSNMHDSTVEEDEVAASPEKKTVAKKASNGEANGATKEVAADA
ncbi:zinc finger protein on ecdysone puffs, partial [Uranotaenia lowii]|uniref:zinc finger protein on ecdysone puffs n=1 Tax=Uranotaenia lowii TaxID=190385 RepID=UPI00247ABF4D